MNHDDNTSTMNNQDRITGSAGSTGLNAKETTGNYSFHPVHPANPVILSSSVQLLALR
jgi:hypothetical protein